MPSASRIVLVDTNVILEAHAKQCWAALTGGHCIETVEMCVTETQTGRQQRAPELLIDESALRESLNDVHEVSDIEIAEVILRGGNGLHDGERHLWAHALTRNDNWAFCGPDTASLRFGYDNKMRSHFVTLEELLQEVGFRPALPIERHYGKKFHDDVMTKAVLGIL